MPIKLKIPFKIAAFAIAIAFAMALSARANMVQDGDFSNVTYSGTLPLTTVYGQFGTGAGSTLTVANWATSGYNFVYAPGTADAGTQANGANTGSPQEAPGQFNAGSGYGNTYMWGPNNGSANSLPATSPVGGNFIAADGAYEVGALTQTITGLTAGKVYVLKFYWAGAQQEGFTGTTSETWQVSLGSQTLNTGTETVASKGFGGWQQATLYFTATTGTEVLSFLAVGTPTGEPPFSLLAGVDLEAVPDFSNWIFFMGFGVACIIFETMRRRKHRRAAFKMNGRAALTT